MPRYKLIIEYDGTDYRRLAAAGQRPVGAGSDRTGLSALDPAPGGLRGAGRTDAGVHATAPGRPCRSLTGVARGQAARRAQRPMRPEKVAILAAEAVAGRFRRALFGAGAALSLPHRQPPRAVDLRFGARWLVKRRLDADAMHEAAQLLLGKHDFSTFRDSDCQAENPVRTLDRLDVCARARKSTSAPARAPSCIGRCARMVGSLEHVGSGKWRPEDLKAALDACDRARCGQVAPAAGLYLSAWITERRNCPLHWVRRTGFWCGIEANIDCRLAVMSAGVVPAKA